MRTSYAISGGLHRGVRPAWARPALLALEALVAASALGGAVWGFAGAKNVPPEWLEGTPFHSYLVPSLILLVSICGGMTVAAAALLVRHTRAAELSIAAGLILIGWIAAQVAIIVPQGGFSWLQPAMAAAGLVIATLGWSLRTPRSSSRTRVHKAPPLALGLFTIATGLGIVSILGPLVTGAIDYRVSQTLRNQTIGLDAVSLLVVMPLSLAAGVLVLRRHVAGPAMALAIGAYTSYMFVQYIIGPEYLRRPGNNELLFPFEVVLFAAGWLVVITAWTERLPVAVRRDRLIGRFVLPLLAFVAFSRYVPALADAMNGQPTDPGYRAGPTFFWAIAMLDLGVFLPATVAACVGLARRAAWASKALYTVVGWFGLVGPAVAAMAITMYVNGDPNASASTTVFMTALGLVFAVFALYLYRPLFDESTANSKGDRP